MKYKMWKKDVEGAGENKIQFKGGENAVRVGKNDVVGKIKCSKRGEI